MTPSLLKHYAQICGWTLAHSHARAGDPFQISGYIGSGTVFAEALTEFGYAYADQAQRDFEAFTAAIASGRIEAKEG
jgi:predicted alpha/beta hydrolase